MKTILALTLALGAATAFAQQDTSTSPPTPPNPEMRRPGGPERSDREFVKNLPPELQQRLEVARKKALEDPAIKALRDKAESANREFFEAMKAKIAEIDPGLAEIMKKKIAEKMRDGKRGDKGGDKGLASLTDEERSKLIAAREIAKTSPAVKAAEAQREAAKTPDEKMAAFMAYHEAMRSAILTADPSLKEVLEKIKPDFKQRPGGGEHGKAPGAMAPDA